MLDVTQSTTMRFENKADLIREEQAIQKFVDIFGGSFKKLGPNDVDYRVFNSSKELIAYVEVKGRLRPLKEAKLSAKRLNPVMIWACEDGIIYAKVSEIQGDVRWGGRKPRANSVNDEELMIYYNQQKGFKYVRF